MPFHPGKILPMAMLRQWFFELPKTTGNLEIHGIKTLALVSHWAFVRAINLARIVFLQAEVKTVDPVPKAVNTSRKRYVVGKNGRCRSDALIQRIIFETHASKGHRHVNAGSLSHASYARAVSYCAKIKFETYKIHKNTNTYVGG